MCVNIDYLKCNLGKIQKIKYGDKIINLDAMPSYDISVKDNILNVDNIKIPLNIVDEMNLLKVKIYIPELIGVYYCEQPFINEVITYKEALERTFYCEYDRLAIMSHTSQTFNLGSSFNIDGVDRMFSGVLDDIKNKYEFIRLYFSIWSVLGESTREMAFLDIDEVEFIPNEFYIKRTELIKKIDRFLSERGLRRDYLDRTHMCYINNKSCIANILEDTTVGVLGFKIQDDTQSQAESAPYDKRNILDKVFNFI